MNSIQNRMSWHDDKVEELDHSVRENAKLNKTSHTQYSTMGSYYENNKSINQPHRRSKRILEQKPRMYPLRLK